jgi:hypothetical protein
MIVTDVPPAADIVANLVATAEHALARAVRG